jgi:putative acetyltransferase
MTMADEQGTGQASGEGLSPLRGLVIRARRPADAEAIADLVNLPGVRFGTMRLPFHSPQDVAGWSEKSPSTNLDLVAMKGDLLFGQAGLYRFTGRQSHVAGLGMCVHDAWTGRGVGAALLEALLDAADNWLGIRRLQLTVYTDNGPAIGLYTRCGFEVEGTHRAYALRDGRYVDAHTMARLGGPDPLAAGGERRDRL